jgi:hypothetical protein
LQSFEQLPSEEQDQDRQAVTIRVSGNAIHYNYGAVVRDGEHDDAPTWCAVFVSNLKVVMCFIQWHHTLSNTTVLEKGDAKEFYYILLYNNDSLVQLNFSVMKQRMP